MEFDNICKCIALRKASNNITKLYDSYLSKINIKVTQYSTLKNIHKLGNVNVHELAIELELERTTVLRNLDKLKKMGLISYKKNINDKTKTIKLTINGNKKLNEANTIWWKAQKKFINILGPNDQRKFDIFLNKISKLNF
jgi:DNA-binding MarR family transcriptional regulator